MNKFDNGIYPVIPGLSVALGDYGTYSDNMWHKEGNVFDIKNVNISLSDAVVELNQRVELYSGVEFDCCAQGEEHLDDSIPLVDSKASIKFSGKDSIFFKGILTSEKYFTSLRGEVAACVENLKRDGLWQDNYWLAYYIIYAKDFVSMRNAGSECKVEVSAKTDIMAATCGAKFNFKHSSNELQKVQPEDPEIPQFAGAKFISLRQGVIRRKVWKIKYRNAANEPVDFYWDEDNF